MEFKLEDIEETFNGEIINKISNNEYLIKIQDKEHHLQILNINSSGMEFVLDNHFHSVNYIENQTAEMKIVVDGVPLTVNMHTKLDEIVYRNTGGADTGSVQINLRSQIPGKVVSIGVKVGDKVTEGQKLAIVEAMKMQHEITASIDGEVSDIYTNIGNQVSVDEDLLNIKQEGEK